MGIFNSKLFSSILLLLKCAMAFLSFIFLINVIHIIMTISGLGGSSLLNITSILIFSIIAISTIIFFEYYFITTIISAVASFKTINNIGTTKFEKFSNKVFFIVPVVLFVLILFIKLT